MFKNSNIFSLKIMLNVQLKQEALAGNVDLLWTITRVHKDADSCVLISLCIFNGYQEVDRGLPKTEMENNKWLKHSKYSDVR